jgi:glutamate dehydrogenase/leucine dehydrogenase
VAQNRPSYDPACGLHRRSVAGVEMLIAVDSTRRGPALGGCRWKTYPDEAAACADVSALGRAMTLKAALARLALGGGKAVVIGDPITRTREQLLALGDFIEELGGAYITAADMGTGQEDMAVIAERTRHVAGLPRRLGGCGDPGPFTAQGLLLAIEAALEHCDRELRSARVAIQGLGSVGGDLAKLLLERGAAVIGADPRLELRRTLPREIQWVEPQAILGESCDVLSPCGPPFVIDRRLAGSLGCRIVCGGANNPLVDDGVAGVLAQRGILYVPDFLANAGGLIHLAVALEGGDDRASQRHLQVIPENLAAVITQAKADHADMAATARRMAESLVQA